MPTAAEKPRETPRRPGRARSPRKEPPKAPAVQIHAHRGGAALAPENTMAAFDLAVDLGVHFIELDVRSCASGELVVVHDADLFRLGGIKARVDGLGLAELQSIDVGSHFDPEYSSARIPSLVEVLETFRNQVRFNIEIKEDDAGGDGTAVRLGRLISEMGLYADVILSSFNPFSLLRAARHCSAPTALVFPPEGAGRVSDRVLKRGWAASVLPVYAIHPREDRISASMIQKAHLRGLAVNAWTVNDESRIQELAAWKVNGIITDRPDRALQLTQALDPLQRSAPGMPGERPAEGT